VFRPGSPIALITNRCLFELDRERRRFRLASVHPGHSVDEVVENTGFDFDRLAEVPTTSAPDAETLELMRNVVAPQLAEVYPQFAKAVATGAFADPSFPGPTIAVWEECRHPWVTLPPDTPPKRMTKQG
jgi:hypothetical protein